MKRIVVITFIVLACSIFLYGCSNIIEEIWNVDQYDEIWNKAEFYPHVAEWYNDRSPLFPAELSITGDSLYMRRTEELPLGGTYQILVSRKNMSKTDISAEIERMHSIGAVDNSTLFCFPALISVFADEGCAEYALIDSDSMTIYYVFLQGVSVNDLKIPPNLLPKEYKDYVVTLEYNLNIYK